MNGFNINQMAIGTDLVEVERFKNIKMDSRFAKNIFTEQELRYCQKKPAQNLAGLFAAKEAVKKTIKENIRFNEIEIIHAKNGAPRVNFLNKDIKKKYKSLITISDIKSIAQAACLTYKLINNN
jgi:holo-[acyl-carrier protein] synthase